MTVSSFLMERYMVCDESQSSRSIYSKLDKNSRPAVISLPLFNYGIKISRVRDSSTVDRYTQENGEMTNKKLTTVK